MLSAFSSLNLEERHSRYRGHNTSLNLQASKLCNLKIGVNDEVQNMKRQEELAQIEEEQTEKEKEISEDDDVEEVAADSSDSKPFQEEAGTQEIEEKGTDKKGVVIEKTDSQVPSVYEGSVLMKKRKVGSHDNAQIDKVCYFHSGMILVIFNTSIDCIGNGIAATDHKGVNKQWSWQEGEQYPYSNVAPGLDLKISEAGNNRRTLTCLSNVRPTLDVFLIFA